MQIITAARRYGIPSRPTGVHSRPSVLPQLSDQDSALVRSATEGQLHGWQRLHRFSIAMKHPTIKAAARKLGIHPSTLLNQIQRLQRDTGQRLYHKSTPHPPPPAHHRRRTTAP